MCCLSCPPLFTDRQKHDVGTGVAFHDHPDESGKIPEMMGNDFDTPSLRELWATDPFLHDGRASTLREVLVKFNLSGDHGKTADLSKDDLLALEMFLLSLPLSDVEIQEIFD
jgi:cytochrome c peroxidase